MLKAVISYSAMYVKVRALKGKMLSEDDWQRLMSCGSVYDAGVFLRRCPGWATAMENLPSAHFTVGQLENALKLQLFDEFERLYRFASAEDKKFLLFAVWKTELTYILSALRRILSIHSIPAEEAVSDFFRQRSRADLNAIAESKDYHGLLAAARHSFFAGVLAAVPVDAETGRPDYVTADVALQNYWYAKVWSYVTKSYSGVDKQALVRLIGHEADLLNITHVLRLRRFPGSAAEAAELLIPVRERLKPQTAEALAAARTDGEAVELLAAEGWLKYFPDGLADPDRQYRVRMEAFCRKLLMTSQPNLCMVQAYLILKELEADRLIRVIQAVRYGVDPATVL